MKRLLSYLFVVALSLSLLGCSNFSSPAEYMNLPDAYNAGTDFHNGFSTANGLPRMTASEDGYYFFGGSFLHYLDRATMEANPVCNRPECMHQTLTCPAAFMRGREGFIQYYAGKLYVAADEYSPEGHYACYLYEVNPSDCTRQKICQLPYGSDDSAYYMMHRGYLYSYAYETTKVRVCRTALNELANKSLEPEIVFETDSYSGSQAFMIGNHIIVMATEMVSSDQYYKTVWWDVNLITKEAKAITVPGEEEGSMIWINSTYDSGAVLSYASPESLASKSSTDTFYGYDCQTGEVELLHVLPEKERIMSEFFFSDGENWMTLYADLMFQEELDHSGQMLCLLDESFQPVKTLSFDFMLSGQQIGDENFMFFGKDDAPNVLYAVDKQAETLEFEEITYYAEYITP